MNEEPHTHVATNLSTLQRMENEIEDERGAAVVPSEREEEEGSRASMPFSSPSSEKGETTGISSSLSHTSDVFLPLPMVTVITPSSSAPLIRARIREHREYPSHRSHDRKASSPATLLCLTCPVCQKKFIGDGSYSGVQSNFKRHLRMLHSSLPVARFPCLYCKASFTTNGNRARHVRVVHKDPLTSHSPTEARRDSGSHDLDRSPPLFSTTSFLPTASLSSTVSSLSSMIASPEAKQQRFPLLDRCPSHEEAAGVPLVGLDVGAKKKPEKGHLPASSAAASIPSAWSTRELTAVMDQASTFGELCAALPQVRTVYRIAPTIEEGPPHEEATPRGKIEMEEEKTMRIRQRGEGDQRDHPPTLLSSSLDGDDNFEGKTPSFPRPSQCEDAAENESDDLMEGNTKGTPKGGTQKGKSRENRHESHETKRGMTTVHRPLFSSVRHHTPAAGWSLLHWWESGCPPSARYGAHHRGTTSASTKTLEKDGEEMLMDGAMSASFSSSPSILSPLPLPPPPPPTSLLFQAYALESVGQPFPTPSSRTFASEGYHTDDGNAFLPASERSPPAIRHPWKAVRDTHASSVSSLASRKRTPVFRCVPCGRVFASAYTLYQHQRERCRAAAAIAGLPSGRATSTAENGRQSPHAAPRHTPAMPSSFRLLPSTTEDLPEGTPTATNVVDTNEKTIAAASSAQKEEDPRGHSLDLSGSSAFSSASGVHKTGGNGKEGSVASATHPTVAQGSSTWQEYSTYLSQLVQQEKNQKRHASAASPMSSRWRCEWCEREVSARNRLRRHQRFYCPFRDEALSDRDPSMTASSRSLLTRHLAVSSENSDTIASAMSSSHGNAGAREALGWPSSGLWTDSSGASRTSNDPSSHSTPDSRDLLFHDTSSSFPHPAPSSIGVPPSTTSSFSSLFSIDRHSHVYASATALVGEMVRRRMAMRRQRKAHLECIDDRTPVKGMRKLETRGCDEVATERTDTERENRCEREKEVSEEQETAKDPCGTHRTDVPHPLNGKGQEDEQEWLEKKEKKKDRETFKLLTRSISCPVDSCSLTFFSFSEWKKHAAVKHPSFTL